MEILKFLKVKPFKVNGYGYGDGSGYGDGDGDGYGSGSGYGYGDGDGSGYGDGDGDGYGSGSGYKIKKLNNKRIYYVDGIPCVFKSIIANIAKVTLIDNKTYGRKEDCYIAKNDYLFAHGKTIREAVSSLNNKYYANYDIETKIGEFKKLFVNGKLSNKILFDWHGILTGSCLLGREQFAKQNSVNLEDEMTLDEFINLTINNYGSEVIKRLK